MAIQQVTNDVIADGSIATNHLADANVTTVKLAASAVTPAKLSQPLTQGTAVATTSGTSIDFTGIPSWVKRVTVMLNNVSTNGTSPYLIQLGAGSVTTTGYTSACSYANASTVSAATNTAGFVIGVNPVAATDIRSGIFTFTNQTGNTWVGSGVLVNAPTTSTNTCAGVIALGGSLDRVRLTTINGTDAFDLGSVNILYE